MYGDAITVIVHIIGISAFISGVVFVYVRSRKDVKNIRKEIHMDLEKMTESLLYVIEGFTKIRKDANKLLENQEEKDRQTNDLLSNLNMILKKTRNGKDKESTN